MRVLMVVVVLAFGGWPGRGSGPARAPGRRRTQPRPVLEPHPAWSIPLMAGLLCLLIGLLLGSPLAMVGGPILAAGAWCEVDRRRRRRRLDEQSEALLQFVDATVAGLRAGGSLTSAVMMALENDRIVPDGSDPPAGQAEATHRHPGLETVDAGLSAGRSLAASFSESIVDGVAGDERVVAATIVALHGSGSAAIGALERVADTLRERGAWQEDLRTQGQQALSSAAVMSVLPVFFALAAALADPDVAELYRSRWLGAICAGSALLLSLVGWEWQQRLLAAR